jgi:two-component system, LytTR family, sensor kinase
MKSKYPVKKLVTLSIWITTFFILFEVTVTLEQYGTEGLSRAIRNSIIAALILILNAFINLALLLYLDRKIVKHKYNHRKIYLISSYSFSIILYVIVTIGYTIINHDSVHSSKLIYVVILCLLVNTLIVTLQNYVMVQEAKINSDIENARLKVANAEAANQLLRQQIHPHMLFNSLNTIKSLYNRNTADADDYLAYLSDFLRASILNNNIKVIPLADELKLCEAYLSMQKIRFGEALTWAISLSNIDRHEENFVPSFSIQPLVENAIKHNELTKKYPLHVSIKQVNDLIKVSNKIRLKEYTENSSGFGLANLAERYKHISDDEVIIEDDGHVFSVSIKILSNENSNYRG